jgi:hydroxymethylbilane synthase
MSKIEHERSTVVLGTRGSKLAVQQSQWVQEQLHSMAPHVSVTIQKIQTSGDKTLDVPLAKIGGKGLFVKEIEEALLTGEIDLAVHSMKDVPTELPEGLAILCVPPREDSRDALISRHAQSFKDLPHGARIGTSSLRRQSQLLHARPDFTIVMLRGNLDTRLKKLREGQFDAIVLAAAGLRRLAWAHEITEYLAPPICLSAIGQGALGIEGRRDDLFIRSLLDGLDHAPSKTAILAERALLHRLQGGCQVPIAAHATVAGKGVRLEGLVASVDGKELIRDTVEGTADDPEAIGIQLAERLLARGADRILQAIYGTT